MQLDALALRMRPRAPLEAADLGVRLCQDAARSVYACYAVVYRARLPRSRSLRSRSRRWLPTLLLVLGEAVARSHDPVRAVARGVRPGARRSRNSGRRSGQVWWRQLFLTWTWRRLSPWRSFTQPVYQLEGLPFGRIRQRVKQVRRRKAGTALLMTLAFVTAETCLVSVTVLSLLVWFAPGRRGAELRGAAVRAFERVVRGGVRRSRTRSWSVFSSRSTWPRVSRCT